MADQQQPPPDTGVPRLAVAQAFGFQLDVETVSAAMQATLDSANQVTQSLMGQINKSMVDGLAGAAVQTDQFKQQIGSSLAAPVITAQSALQQLQQPIYSAVVNQLGSTIEATIPLGVNPTVTPGESTCPACVQIRQAGQNHDLGPAIECFRASALPHYGVDGVRYSSALSYIQQCLPGDSVLQNLFLAQVNQLTTEPAVMTPATAPGMGAPPGPYVPKPAAVTPGQTSGAGAPPIQTRTSILPGGGLPPGSPLAPFLPGGGSQISLPPGGGASTGGGAGIATGGGGGAGSAGGALPPVPSCQQLEALGIAGAMSAFPAGQYAGPAGEIFSLNYGVDPASGLHIAAIACTNCPPGIGPVPQECFFQTQAPTPPPGSPPPLAPPPVVAPPVTPPTQPAPGPCPAPPTCQPVQVTVKPCDTQPPPPPTPRTYCVWQNVETKVCYVDTQDNGPRSPNDQKLFCGKIDAGFVTQAIAACCQQQQQQQYPGGAGLVMPVGAPFQGGCADFPPAPIGNAGGTFLGFLQWIGVLDANGQVNVPFPNAGALDVGQNITNSLFQLFGGMLPEMARAVDQFISGTGCADGTQVNLIATSALLGFADRWLGADLTQLALPLAYQRQFRCPVTLPTQTQAATAWLANEIDDGTLDCWLRANNIRPEEAHTWIHGSRTKLAPLQYAQLYMRDFLNPQDFALRLRSAGMLQQTDPADLLNLLVQIPPPTDLTRFMVRDVADENFVQQFQLDADFDKKFAGRLKDWARQQGVSEEYMRYFWRAHWSIPAPGQLAEMLHRNSRLPAGDPAYVDQQIIRAALEQQDIAPFWIDKFISISYRPLTRIDARRAFEIGALNEDDLREAYLNLGYAPDNANTLVEFNRKNVMRTFMRRGEIKQLAEGVMGNADFDTAMRLFGADDEIIAQGRDYADLLRRVNGNKVCLKAYHKRFIQGDIDATTALLEVQALGQTLEAATTIVEGWKCEVVSRGKNFSFSQLNQLYEQGLIDENDYVRRAVRLGWEQDDAVLMLRLIQRRLNIKITNAQIAEARREQAAAEKLARQLRQQERQSEADQRREANSIARIQRLKELREKRILEAGEKFSVASGMALPDAIVYVKGLFATLVTQYPVTHDEAISSLLVITSDKAVSTTVALEQALATALTNLAS